MLSNAPVVVSAPRASLRCEAAVRLPGAVSCPKMRGLDVSTACVDSRLFELCMRLRYREVNGKGSDDSSQVFSSFQHALAKQAV